MEKIKEKIITKIEKYHFTREQLEKLDGIIFKLRDVTENDFDRIHQAIMNYRTKIKESYSKYDFSNVLRYMKLNPKTKIKFLILKNVLGTNLFEAIFAVFSQKRDLLSKEEVKFRTLQFPSDETVQIALKRMGIYFLGCDKKIKEVLWNDRLKFWKEQPENFRPIAEEKYIERCEMQIPTWEDIGKTVGIDDPKKVQSEFKKVKRILDNNPTEIEGEYKKLIDDFRLREKLQQYKQKLEEIIELKKYGYKHRPTKDKILAEIKKGANAQGKIIRIRDEKLAKESIVEDEEDTWG